MTMITENVFRRTYAVKCGENCGSAILIDLNGRRYLVSAKHVFSSYEKLKKIECLSSAGWMTIDHVYRTQGKNDDFCEDFIVFEVNHGLQAAGDLPFAQKSDNYISQDVYALGYPMLLPSPLSKANGGFALAFVKRGIFSGIISSGGFDELLVMDLLLNKGMSGGPILSLNLEDRKTLQLVGIGVAFFSPAEIIRVGDGEVTYNPNTGLAYCVPISRVIASLV